MSLKLNTPSGGSVTLTVADTVSHTTKVVAGKEELAGSNGAALVGYLPAGVGAVASTVQGKLRESVSVKDFGAVGDGVTDDTAAIQAAANEAGDLLVPGPATYIIDSVSLTKSVTFHCEPGVVFKRKAGADLASGSYWIAGASMFEVDVAGLTITFEGSYTYDGNNANQTTVEPTGSFCKCYPPTVVTGEPTILSFSNGVFKNGTSSYLLLRGDDIQRRYATLVNVSNCRFYDTVKGIGKGDPSTPNVLGYLPTYVYVLDCVRLSTYDFHAEWNGALTTGEYAACALNGTFFGVSYANSGEAFIYMHGTTYIKGLGRSGKKYNNDADYVTNNGIGAIDCYGNADTLFVEALVAVNSQNVPLRAKGSLKNYTVLSAELTNCHRGLQVGPSTTGACETRVYVGSVKSYGGTIPQLEFVGSTTVDMLPSVSIESAVLTGPFTNPEALVASDVGVSKIRNVGNCTIGHMGVYSAITSGIAFTAVTRVTVKSFILNSAVVQGIFLSGSTIFSLRSFDIRNTGESAITLSGTNSKINISSGYIESAVNYGVFANTTTHLMVDSVDFNGITGTGRGVYVNATSTAEVSNCKSTSVATPLFTVTGALVNESANSWNAVTRYGSSSLITTGTWRVGDIVWSTSPTAGGAVGWVCITAGTPGTWKTFGAISV